MSDKKSSKEDTQGAIIRRDFLKVSGVVYLVAAAGSEALAADASPPLEKVDPTKLVHPPSKGYLLVDTAKCQGCLTCMLACSLVHEGQENLSLARIQVTQDPFEKFPVDVDLSQCRQCLDPVCMSECQTGALHVDTDNGNIRTIDEDLCEGCFMCVESCPHPNSRAIWNFEEEHADKCDLCTTAQFWTEQGGVKGKQACVESCPVGAIKLVSQVPLQKGDTGYKVNLRGEAWEKMGYTID